MSLPKYEGKLWKEIGCFVWESILAAVIVSIQVQSMTVTTFIYLKEIKQKLKNPNYPNQEVTPLCDVFPGDLKKHTFMPRYSTDN